MAHLTGITSRTAGGDHVPGWSLLQDWEVYSSARGVADTADTSSHLLPMEANPPLHGQRRRLLNPFFTRQRVEGHTERSNLARLGLDVALRLVAERVERIELADVPLRCHSVPARVLHELPVRLVAR